MTWRRSRAQIMERALAALGLVALLCIALAGCAGGGNGSKGVVGNSSGGATGTGGTGGGAATSQPTVRVETPRSPLQHAAPIEYTLADPSSMRVDVRVEYSVDDGGTYRLATAASADPRHEGTVGLSTSPLGARHAFVWDTDTDLGAINSVHVKLRITPVFGGNSGQPAETDSFAVINLGRRDPDCNYDPSFGTLVLSVDTRGGFVPASVAINHVTHTRIYGDGKVVYADPNDGDRVIYAGMLSEAQICAMFKVLAEKGFWTWQTSYRAMNAPTDLPTAYIVAKRAGQREKTVSSYGGAISAPPGFMEAYDAVRYPAFSPEAIERYIRVPITQWDLNRGEYFGAEHEKKWDTPSNWVWVAGGGSGGRDVWRKP